MDKLKEKTLLEKWGAQAAALTAILTLVFLLFPYLKPAPSSQSRGSAPTPGSQGNSPGDVILGTWEQFIFVSDTDLRSGGTFLVSRAEGKYLMGAVSQPEDRRSIHTARLSDVQSDGRVWSFVSKLDDGRFVHFVLKKVSDNAFEGCARLGTDDIQCDRWIRVTGR